MRKPVMSIEKLNELFEIDRSIWALRWKVERNTSNARAGDVAGGFDKYGYVKIESGGRSYLAHRIIWAMIHGEWPEHDIDHINGKPDDNRISNLRHVKRSTNLQNQRRAHKDSAVNFLGVKKGYKGKFTSSIYFDGKAHHLGSFKTAEEAHQAYLDAKRKKHDGCVI